MMKLYSLTPFFNSVFRNPDPTSVVVLAGLTYMVYSYQSIQQHIKFSFFICDWLMFLGFRTTLFISGPTLRTMKTTRFLMFGCSIIYFGCVVNMSLATQTLSVGAGKMDEYYFHEFHTVYLMATTSFVVLKGIGELPMIQGSPRIVKVLSTISDHSFGIYLTHPAILDVLRKHLLRPDNTYLLGHPIIGVPLTVLILGACSMSFVAVVKQIPFLRQFVGG